ncbi:MAG: patatin-like phospholipase family protein [Nitrososphaeraceae archaeon]
MKVLNNMMQIRDITTAKQETVLVMQGGGSLGAYECGVYKTLERHGIEFDIVAGTSIGAVNAAIIAGNRDESSAKTLEQFWLSLAERITPSFFADNVRAIFSSMLVSLYGNKNAFEPVWSYPASLFNYYSIFSSYTRIPPHLYDVKPLEDTLTKFVDFDKINKQYRSSISSGSVSGNETKRVSPRLIMTCTDIQRSESVTFDSDHIELDAGHVIACTGFPFYGLAWTKKDGLYLWDGSLLSNTPLREVIDASPKNHKRVYIINLFPKIQNELPTNMFDIWHRARDIIHTDKTDHNIHMSKIVSRYLTVMRQMHDLLNNIHMDENMKDAFFQIEKEYHKLATDRGAIIEEITKIERKEDVRYIFEDADFSLTTIQKLIKQGENDAEKILQEKSKN